jgi:fibronectin type 3 domain-containing protein
MNWRILLMTTVVGTLFAAASSSRSLRSDNPNTDSPPTTPLQHGCLVKNWTQNIDPYYGNVGPYPYPFTMFNPGGLPTALAAGTDINGWSVVGCYAPLGSDNSPDPSDGSSIFTTGTNEFYFVSLDPNYLAVSGEMYFYVADASPENPIADVVMWTLANGNIEVELDNWCFSGTANASFSWVGIAYTGGCTSSTNDFLFDSTGKLIGYVLDSGTQNESFTGTLTLGSAVVTNVTVPGDLHVGGWISDSQDFIPAGTTITAIGAGSITMSASATGSSSGADTMMYTPWSLSTDVSQITSPPQDWTVSALTIPTGLTAISGSGGTVTVNWMPTTGAVSYNLYVGSTPDGEGITPQYYGITSTTQKIPGLPPGTAYYFKVAAVYANDLVSGQSSEVLGTALPATPTGLIANLAGTNSIALKWNASAGAINYSIYQGLSSGAEAAAAVVAGVTNPSYTISGLIPGRAYFFKVAAVNAGGPSPTSNEASATLLAAPPTGLTATAGSGEINLMWAASAGASSYRIYQGATHGGESATPIATGITGTSFAVSNLNPGQTYFFDVVAVDSAGNSVASSEATATMLATIPTGLTALGMSGAVKLGWSASTGAKSYAIFEGASAGAEGATAVSTVTGTSTVISGLTSGQTYYFKVAAVDAGGNSAASKEAPGTVLASVPSGITATAGNGEVTLNWKSSTGAVSYVIYEGTSAGGEGTTAVSSAAGTSAVISGLTNQQAYYFTVAAVDSGGTSAASLEASATPMAPANNGGGGHSGGGAVDLVDVLFGTALVGLHLSRRRSQRNGISSY